MPDPGQWTVHNVDNDGVVFRSPTGSHHAAACVRGRFDLECMWGFYDAMKPKAVLEGVLRRSFPVVGADGVLGVFKLIHPENEPLGKPVTKNGYHLFKIVTPTKKVCVMRFENGAAPLELKGFIERLFGQTAEQTKEEYHEGQPRHRSVPPPGRPEHPEGPGLDRAEGLQGRKEPRRQRKVQRRRDSPGLRAAGGEGHNPLEVSRGSDERKELVKQFLRAGT